MNFYDSEANINIYIGMSKNTNTRILIDRLREYLPKGSTVLELGMGPGADLNILQKHYTATGSDISKPFLERYKRQHPRADLLMLNAISIETDRQFGGIYSNKVLQHISYTDMRASLTRQSQVLTPAGIALHSFWYGRSIENFNGLMFYQVTEEKIQSILPPCYEICEMKRYKEEQADDSIYVILKTRL